jgi:hypothetical protein
MQADRKDIARDRADIRADQRDIRSDHQDLRADRGDMRSDRGNQRINTGSPKPGMTSTTLASNTAENNKKAQATQHIHKAGIIFGSQLIGSACMELAVPCRHGCFACSRTFPDRDHRLFLRTYRAHGSPLTRSPRVNLSGLSAHRLETQHASVILVRANIKVAVRCRAHIANAPI